VYKSTIEAVSGSADSEQRKLPRKAGLLGGVLVDVNGEDPADCTIRNMNARGVAVSHPKILPIGAQMYLLDTGNRVAHLTRVVWNGADHSGLSFVRSYTMGLGLPPKLKFLWRLLLEAKLRQAERAVVIGISPEIAFGSVGLTRELVHRMAPQARADIGFQRLLLRALRLLDGSASPRRSPRMPGVSRSLR
jgi:hypothetical protein